MVRTLKLLAVLVILVSAAGFVFLEMPGSPAAPIQPVVFDHALHVTSKDGPELDCNFCHEYADKSAHATIPNVDTCMTCHSAIAADKPEVQKLAAYADRKEQPPWKRVYWIAPEGDAFFTHKAHVKAGVECSTCHGDVAHSQVLKREVEPTMGWCIKCHEQQQVSVDCYICHR